MARRILKILHLLSAAGVTAGLAAHMVLLAGSPDASLSEYAVLRRNIELVSGWLLVPSMMVCLVSGLFAIAAHAPFQNAGWVWVKAALGIPMFEGSLATIDSVAQRASELSARAAAGEVDAALVSEAVAREWNALWILLALAVAQTVLGVWRPRGRRRRSARAAAQPGA